MTLDYTRWLYIAFHDMAVCDITPPGTALHVKHYMTGHDRTSHSVTSDVHCDTTCTFHSIQSHCVEFHSVTFHFIRRRFTTCHYIPSHNSTLHVISFHIETVNVSGHIDPIYPTATGSPGPFLTWKVAINWVKVYSPSFGESTCETPKPHPYSSSFPCFTTSARGFITARGVTRPLSSRRVMMRSPATSMANRSFSSGGIFVGLPGIWRFP